ncbi:MAG: Omp28-related outer membrane protein [Bacteroidales bacterium]|nr:Omp28-related outer membrane protein [Bacteroidales bacterium]
MQPDAPEDIDWTKAFDHKSLIINFTSSTCGWCPRMNESIRLAREQNPGKILVMNVHGAGSAYPFDDRKPLFTQYNIYGYPTVIMDGRRLVNNGPSATTAVTISNYLKETEDNYPVSSTVSCRSSFSGQKLNIHLTAYLRDAAEYKVAVFVLEDGIAGTQSNYEGDNFDNYIHDSVARIAVSDPLGDPFTTTEANSIRQFDYSVTVPSEYTKANLKILVAVQRRFGTQTVLSDNFGDYYIDNCSLSTAIQ